MTTEPEIIVVGGGPASCAFLVDLESTENISWVYPSGFVKDCTGLLAREAVEWFETRGLIDLLEKTLDKPEITDLVYVSYDGTNFRELLRREDYLTNANRVKLDSGLREFVSKRGVKHYDGYVVESFPTKRGFALLSEKAECFTGKIIVEGTGAYSAVLKSLGVIRPAVKGFGIQWFFRVRSGEIPDENYFVYDLTGNIPYVIWISPKNDEIVIGGPIPPESDIESIVDLAIKTLNEYGYGITRSDLKLERKYYSVAAVPIFSDSFIYYILNKFTSESYVIAIGEAGRFVTPRNVNGIPYALWSGSFAAECVYDPERYKEIVEERLVKVLCSKIEQAKDVYGEFMEVYLWP